MAFEGIQRTIDRIEEIERRIEQVFPSSVPAYGNAGGAFGATLQSVVQRSTQVYGPELEAMIDRVALKHDVDASIVRAVMRQESGGNARAVSRAGAMGLMQLMPGTANALGVRDPFDPEQNLDGGVRYLKGLLERFGSLPLALAAYNAGPGAVRRYGGVPPFKETQRYVRSIMGAIQP